MVSAEPAGVKASGRMRLEFIDGMRALAALYVVLGHAYFEPTNGGYSSRLMSHLGLTYGHLAVDVFIVLSGFCLMLPVARRGDHLGPLPEFLRRRARRILPPYYAALLLSILFIATVAHSTNTGTVWDICPPLTAATVGQHLLLVHDLPLLFAPPGTTVHNGQINYPLWSIAVEVQVYLFMPLVVLSLRRWGNLPTLLWTFAFGLILQLTLRERVELACPWYLGLFCCGAISAREGCRRMGETPRLPAVAAYGLSVLTIVVALAAGNKRFREHPMLFDDLAGIATALLLYVLFLDASTRRHRLSHVLSWPPLVAVGLFSYSLYLIHAPLLHACYLLLHPAFHPSPTVMFLLLIACIPLIVATAYGFHRLFERPFMHAREQGAGSRE
jgi:peptidoglycan/LPS O-acetylase OafA/YrhL